MLKLMAGLNWDILDIFYVLVLWFSPNLRIRGNCSQHRSTNTGRCFAFVNKWAAGDLYIHPNHGNLPTRHDLVPRIAEGWCDFVLTHFIEALFFRSMYHKTCRQKRQKWCFHNANGNTFHGWHDWTFFGWLSAFTKPGGLWKHSLVEKCDLLHVISGQDTMFMFSITTDHVRDKCRWDSESQVVKSEPKKLDGWKHAIFSSKRFLLLWSILINLTHILLSTKVIWQFVDNSWLRTHCPSALHNHN